MDTNTPIDHSQVIESLSRNREVFRGLLDGLTQEEIMWRNAPGKWNLLEVVCHLCDEERDDFRTRVRLVLEHGASAELPPIDPEGWVLSRTYTEQDYQQKLREFMQEREDSITWLRSLQLPTWKNACTHPQFGPMSAEFFLANWLAHDMLHIRQILRLRYHYLAQSMGDAILYAGEW